jgi:Flp pilus assembly protein TadD
MQVPILWEVKNTLWFHIINGIVLIYYTHLIGAAYGKLRELDTAAADCKKAVELAPNDPTNHANLALVYSMMGKWDNAVHECSQALNLGQV